MRQLRLIRIHDNPTATFGYLQDEVRRELCRTMEGPDGPTVCDRAPAGTYTVTRRRAPERDYDTFEFTDVIGSDPIELHIGNAPHETERCICLGSNFGRVNGQEGVTGSPAAFRWFMDALRGEDAFELTITDPDPTPFAATHVAEDV